MPKPKKIFNSAYNQYIEKIYRFIFFKVSSEEIAQDLCSEVFLRFWESLNSPTEIKNTRAFLYQIARNLVIDHYRKKGQVDLVSIDNVSLQDPTADLEKEARLFSELDQIQKAISNLKDDYQDIIIWYYLDEIPIREIAGMLDKSENAVRLIIHRALKSLREFLNN